MQASTPSDSKEGRNGISNMPGEKTKARALLPYLKIITVSQLMAFGTIQTQTGYVQQLHDNVNSSIFNVETFILFAMFPL